MASTDPRALSAELQAEMLRRRVAGQSQTEIARDMKLSTATVSKWLGRMVKEQEPSQVKLPEPVETNEISGDQWAISLPKTRICTLEQLIEHCKIDLSIWEVERFVCNKWEVGRREKEVDLEWNHGSIYEGHVKDTGRIFVEPLFQVKAFLRKKQAVVDALREIEELKQLAKSNAPRLPKIKRPKQPSGNMLELDFPDAHFGKLAWAPETGQGNYDTKIATQIFTRALETLLQRVSSYQFDQILFVLGNDLLNSDNPEGFTTKGTRVSNDGRYKKTFPAVRTLMIDCILRLREIAPVKVIMVPGNHDSLSVWHLGDSLECYFHADKDVEIDNAPPIRKYHRFGNVMLMFCHGDKGKRQDYPLLMATEKPEMFGSTKYREAHTGHLHMTKLDEQHGVRVRVLPALCNPDDWLAENGMLGNQRNAEAYVWNKDEGLICQATYSDDAAAVS